MPQYLSETTSQHKETENGKPQTLYPPRQKQCRHVAGGPIKQDCSHWCATANCTATGAMTSKAWARCLATTFLTIAI